MPASPQALRVTMGDRVLVIFGPGDITRQETDAIVNAANSSLLGGGGVDGAIHRAGGPAILEACREIVGRIGRLACRTSRAQLPRDGCERATSSTPSVRSGVAASAASPRRWPAAITSRSAVADELQLTSIAFPAISTGVYRYPIEQASHVAITSAAEALEKATHVREVRFVLFDSETFTEYGNAARDFAARSSLKVDSIP